MIKTPIGAFKSPYKGHDYFLNIENDTLYIKEHETWHGHSDFYLKKIEKSKISSMTKIKNKFCLEFANPMTQTGFSVFELEFANSKDVLPFMKWVTEAFGTKTEKLNINDEKEFWEELENGN